MTKYKLCQVMAHEEGWGILGDIPTRFNNPLDLRHSPHSSHAGEDPNAIGHIDTIDDGWADADRQMEMWAARGLDLRSMVATEAPPDVDGNHFEAYLLFVCQQMQMVSWTPVSVALKVGYDQDYP